MSLLLIGDIGRISTLNLINTDKTDKPIFQKQYRSGDYKSLEEIVANFLKTVSTQYESDYKKFENYRVCFALPCPIKKNQAELRLTRSLLNWPTIDKQELKERFGFKTVELVNDFEAVGYGLIDLLGRDLSKEPAPPEFYTVRKNKISLSDNNDEARKLVVIGAGTGLGEAFIINNKSLKTPIVCPTEGGHTDYAPYSENEIALWQFLQQDQDNLFVETEMVVSGRGIVDIYRFLREKFETSSEKNILKDKIDEDVKIVVEIWEKEKQLDIKSLDPAAEIAKAAFLKKCPLCRRTMQMFIKAYGAEAGNMALKFLPNKGVYIAGSIAPRILPFFDNIGFMDAFENKHIVGSHLLKDIPIYVILDRTIGLRGANFFLQEKGKS